MARTPILSRRDWLRLAAAGVVGTSTSGWFDALAADLARNPQRKRSCILLWMNGGPSQMDTFDLKPGHANGGPFKEIPTAAPGLKISEHLPRVARFGDRMAVVRSMSTKEGDHSRATFLMRTGYLPQGPVQYPSIGAHVAHELGSDDSALPNAVAIAPYTAFSPGAYGPGFLGPKYAPLVVGDSNVQLQPQGQPVDYDQALKVKDLAPPKEVSDAHADARIELLKDMEKDFVARHPDVAPHSHLTAYDRAIRLMRTDAAKAFDIEEEKGAVRDRYGRNLFGQGCLLARRLVERGVPFVEVTLGGVNGGAFGWDTHADNFNQVKRLSETLDPAWAALMTDLKERGLLDSTLIVWMGEFGRTPKIEGSNGRNHFPNAWSTVLAGGGVKGGQAYGKTSADGTTVEENPVSVPNFIATVCAALGIDSKKQNQSNVGRPIRIADVGARPIKEVLDEAPLLLLPLAAALAVLPAPAAAPAPADPIVDDDDVQDLVFFSDTRPVLIRLHVRVDGKPYYAAWEAYVHELFNYLDRNGDGVLSKDEAARAPSGTQFQQMRQFGYTYGIGGAATYATFGELDADEDEEVTYEEFRAYYRRTGAGGLQIYVSPAGRAATADPLTDALFRLLDKNKDGKLSRDELAAAEKVLRPFDEDDNELVSARELTSGGAGNPYGLGAAAGGVMMAPPRKPGGEDKSSFFLVTPDDSPNRLTLRLGLAEKVIKRYDKDGNKRLSRAEIGLDRDVFKELDTNKDGELDAVELMRLLRRPPDVEAVVRLGKIGAKDSPTDTVAPGGKARALASAVRPGTAGTLLVTLGDSQIDLRRTDATTGASDEQIKMQSDFVRQQYVARLKEADPQGRGYVELLDVRKPQFVQLQTLFSLADRDGDGKLTEAEVNAWFELQAKAVGSYVSLAVTENGRGLFDILDANRDGSLGLRELRTAWERLKPYDRDGDGCISREEIPRQFQLTLGLGQAAALGGFQAPGPGAGQPTAVTARGPVWFRKMDRNGDGDVSLREFLGTREEFEKIDTDHDGLISVAEAERYDETLRDKK